VTSRLLGLALLDRERAGPGLLIPRCRSVHTFGMRFALEVVFIDAAGRPVSRRRRVPRRRFLLDPRAAAVLERPEPYNGGRGVERTRRCRAGSLGNQRRG
jgi:hypothetical protein